MEVVSVAPSRTVEFVHETLLVALSTIGCILSTRATFFVVASDALTVGFVYQRLGIPVGLSEFRPRVYSGGACPIIGADQQYFDFTHQTACSPWSLDQVLPMAGVPPVEVRPVLPPHARLARAIPRLLQQSVLAVLQAYLWISTRVPRPLQTHSMVAYAWN